MPILDPHTLAVIVAWVMLITPATAQEAGELSPERIKPSALGEQASSPYWIGVRCVNVGTAEPHVAVRQTIPNAPAARAGIEPGDQLISVDETQLQSVEQLGQIVRASNGKRLKIKLRRGENMLDVALLPARRTVVSYALPMEMDSDELARWIQRQANSGFGPGINLRLVNPGIVMRSRPPELPADTEFTIRNTDGAIQIVVRHGDDQWVVSPKTARGLPPEARRWAEQLQNLVNGHPALMHALPPGLNVLFPSQDPPPFLDVQTENERLSKQVQDLNRQVERLRQVIDQLQSQQSDPTDNPDN